MLIRKQNLLVLGVVCGLGAMLAGCGHSQAAGPGAAAAPEVTVAQVIAMPLHRWEEFTGRMQAVDSVEVHPRVSGYIDSVQFTEGARVGKGQLLFQIDPRPFQYEVDRLQAEQQRAQSHLDFASADKSRAERLLAQNAIAREEYEQLISTEAEASADLGSVRAQLEAARLNLAFTQVRSPIDGHASRALITSGNLVSSANALTTVVSDDPVYAYFDTDEATYLKFAKSAGSAQAPAPVYLGLTGEQGYPHQGRLDFLDNQIDPRSGTIRARAVFDNKDGRYTPGLFARIKLVARDSYNAILIDDKAIGTDLGKKYVLVLKPDSSLEYRLVDLGPSLDGMRVVQDGLTAEDTVVVNGLQHVMPGIKVQATRVSMNLAPIALEQVAAVPSAPSVTTPNLATPGAHPLVVRATPAKH